MDLRETFSSLDASPNKILKIVIGISVVLLLMWLLTISQMDYGNDVAPKDRRSVFKTAAKADSVATQSDSTEMSPVKADDESPGLFSDGLVTFFVLLVILGGIWVWVDRKAPQAKSGDRRQIANVPLDEGAKLKIIRINEEIWVLGVTGNSVNLLHRYSKSEWNEELKDPEENKELFKKLFKNQMS